MPYSWKKKDGKYTVYKKDTGKKVGTTGGSKEALRKYLAALHMHAESCTYFKTFEQFINEAAVSYPDDASFNYKGYECRIFKTNNYGIGPFYSCSVYKNNNYVAGIKGSQPLDKSIECAKNIVDSNINRTNENGPCLTISQVTVGDQVDISGAWVEILDIIDRVDDNIISFVGKMPDGSEITFKYDDGCDDYVVAT